MPRTTKRPEELLDEDGHLILRPVLIPIRQVLEMEREVLGCYISGHPFAQVEQRLAPLIDLSIDEIDVYCAGQQFKTAGLVREAQEKLTKNGAVYCRAVIEDTSASLHVVIWPRVYMQTKQAWKKGKIVLITVKVQPHPDSEELFDTIVEHAEEVN